ncbi:HNH nuclease [Chlorobium limicola DSM 245]|uniref:HNH nuclease n=1 Tax=Chlorobium limicola (strain DSM 245 / NBRC 103803 / 6330) TaxID=290315 RepID=B3EGZ5_CHLL2|nr:HNH endonuclease [Chlorobium limicola]ACD89675.1 HNH nuclease [Chlorobium limicola DSM 245]
MKKAKLSVSEEAEGKELRNRLIALRRLREQGKDANRRPRRFRLTTEERAAILRKTGGKCHICGGDISGRWHADHVLAHSTGGIHAAENFLPAHVTCNNYRWDYLPEEFELILKLGVWARSEVEKDSDVGLAIAKKFSQKELKRQARRKNTASDGA